VENLPADTLDIGGRANEGEPFTSFYHGHMLFQQIDLVGLRRNHQAPGGGKKPAQLYRRGKV
jgi:hypothetical protein